MKKEDLQESQRANKASSKWDLAPLKCFDSLVFIADAKFVPDWSDNEYLPHVYRII